MKINYRREARGRECQVRLPCCNGNPETTVLAHLSGGGMGAKRHDLHGAWACSACHDAIDGRAKAFDYDGSQFLPHNLKSIHMAAVIRTQEALMAEGKL